MKITKRQLRRIIKEEKQRILKEMTPGEMGIAAAKMDDQKRSGDDYWVNQSTDAMGNLHSAIDTLINVLGKEEAYLELVGIVEDWQ